MKDKPVDMNDNQVRRVLELWFRYIKQQYGYIANEPEKVELFIEWLEQGKPGK